MKIVQVQAIAVAVPLRGTFQIASGAIPSGRNVIIRCRTDTGVEGLGEASPVAATDADTQRSIVDIVTREFEPRLLGKDPLDLPTLLATVQTAVPGNQCAKAGMDIALHDLAGKVLGLPVYQMLGGLFRREIALPEADIWLDTPENMAACARTAYEAGVRNFEIKIGVSPAMDYERVQAVRRAVGPQARIRADCNEGYDAANALRSLRKLEAFDLEYIEQPLPRWDCEGMARLAAALDTPICADQAAYTTHDVFRLLSMAAADLICIKIPKSGLAGAQTIHATCEAAGVRCTLGSMLPLGIGAAAIHHFALHARNVDIECSGVYGSPLDYYQDDLVHGSMVGKDGVIRACDAPGLGVRLDEAKLERYSVQ